MLTVMLRKLMAKKWMTFCVVLGSVLLIATMISLPLYQNAAFDRMLRDEFKAEYVRTGVWPAQLNVEKESRQRTGAAVLFEMENLLENMDSQLGVTTINAARFYRTVERQVTSLMGRDDDRSHYKVRLSMYSDLEEHATVLNGEMYSEDGYTEDGIVEIVITEECMLANGFVVGETLGFSSLRDSSGEQFKVKIVGIIEPKQGDIYWEIGSDELQDVCLIQESVFREMFLGNLVNEYLITCRFCYLFEYDNLVAGQVESMLNTIQSELYEGNLFGPILENYMEKLARIEATLLILQAPLIILLVSFLFMITRQMYEVERNEIAVIKSRGSSRGQIFRLYLYQIIFVTMIATLFGIPLGIVFFKMLGSASGFLEFGVARYLPIVVSEEVYLYLLAAILTIIIVMTFPAIQHSKVSIVHVKQAKASKKRALWEVCFLDVLCLGVGIYGYYNFKRTEELLVEDVLSERALDPLMYLSSSLFIIGLGLLFLRLQPLLAKLIYTLGQRILRPAAYASLLEMMRSSRKQQFVMLFLILTISLGTFHATVAQTIMVNARGNTEYLTGADAIIKENWKHNAGNVLAEGETELFMHFYEPDYGKYETLPGVLEYTKVFYDDVTEETSRVRTYFKGAGKKEDGEEGKDFNFNTMLISPKEFGEKTWVDPEFTEQHYYEYLNLLTDNPDGVLISRSMADAQGLSVGHSVHIHYEILMVNHLGSPIYENFNWTGRVVGIIDYWPAFEPTYTYVDENGVVVEEENYLLVGNYSAFQAICGVLVQPYEVWIDLEEDTDPALISEWIRRNELSIERYINGQNEMESTETDPLLQGTNGILTMEFIVMILLCAVGYLVYWVMSIRDREMMFGVLRAFGMHKNELLWMLSLEQLLSGVLTALVAIGIGRLTSGMYTPMMQAAYAAAQQVLPMKLSVDMSDMIRLYVSVALVLVICLTVLAGYVFRLNMTKALKLGED